MAGWNRRLPQAVGRVVRSGCRIRHGRRRASNCPGSGCGLWGLDRNGISRCRIETCDRVQALKAGARIDVLMSLLYGTVEGIVGVEDILGVVHIGTEHPDRQRDLG